MTEPTSRPSSTAEMVDLTVRGFGYEVRHVVRVPATSVRDANIYGTPFRAVRTPLLARCGVRVRSVQDVVVVMPFAPLRLHRHVREGLSG